VVIDPLSLSKNLAQRDALLNANIEDALCPIILGCYGDKSSEEHLAILRTACKNAGFTNALILTDIPDVQPIDYNLKFKFLIQEYKDDKIQKRIVCPVFYIHPTINEGKGKGLISEFLDVLNHFPDLREFTIVLRYANADFIEQLEYIHPKNVYHVNSINEGIEWLIPHLKGHYGFLKQSLWKTQSLKSKNLLSDSNEVT